MICLHECTTILLEVLDMWYRGVITDARGLIDVCNAANSAGTPI